MTLVYVSVYFSNPQAAICSSIYGIRLKCRKSRNDGVATTVSVKRMVRERRAPLPKDAHWFRQRRVRLYAQA
jgi:hypothetical protein